MATESDESPVLRAALIVVAVGVLYVLSTGPVYRSASVSGEWPLWRDTVYFPLACVAERCHPVSVALEWYAAQWGPASGSRPLIIR